MQGTVCEGRACGMHCLSRFGELETYVLLVVYPEPVRKEPQYYALVVPSYDANVRLVGWTYNSPVNPPGAYLRSPSSVIYDES